eukprot:402100-Amphidinium_carterae.1
MQVGLSFGKIMLHHGVTHTRAEAKANTQNGNAIMDIESIESQLLQGSEHHLGSAPRAVPKRQ